MTRKKTNAIKTDIPEGARFLRFPYPFYPDLYQVKVVDFIKRLEALVASVPDIDKPSLHINFETEYDSGSIDVSVYAERYETAEEVAAYKAALEANRLANKKMEEEAKATREREKLFKQTPEYKAYQARKKKLGINNNF